MSATVVALIVVGIILTSATTALLTISQSIPTSGTVATPTPTPTPSTPPIVPTPTPSQGTVDIGVYSDSAFTNEYSSTNSIAWGAVMPGQNATKTVYIRNEGTTAVELHLTTANLTPTSAEGLITVTWNKEGTTLAVGANTSATLTLSVSSSISGITSYSVDVVITGTAP
jgi:hypothetical protein